MSTKKHGSYQVFCCEVDLYRNGTVFRPRNARLQERSTRGVYYVNAKNRRHAMVLLQKAIGFGQVCIPRHQYIPDGLPEMKKNGIVKYVGGTEKYTDRIARATDPIAKGDAADA